MTTRLRCRCGHDAPVATLSDAAFLIWRSDFEDRQRRARERVSAYLSARALGRAAEWLHAHHYTCACDEDLEPAEAIERIYGVEDVFSIDVWRCPRCTRLYVQETAEARSLVCYAPESPRVTYAEILADDEPAG